MASKKGKQPRRKLPKPLLENFEDFLLPKIECSKCNRNFEVTLLGGKFLNRTCPYCGKKIVPAEYDSKASEYLKTIQSIQEALVVYKEEATRLQTSLLNCAKWWHVPKKTILRFRLKLFQKYKSPKVQNLLLS